MVILLKGTNDDDAGIPQGDMLGPSINSFQKFAVFSYDCHKENTRSSMFFEYWNLKILFSDFL